MPKESLAATVEEVDRRIEDDDLEGAIALARSTLRRARPKDEVERLLEGELRLLLAEAELESGDPGAALASVRAAAAVDPRDPDRVLLEARALFHLWRFGEARERLAAVEPPPELRATWAWYEGLVAEFQGDEAEAGRRFAAAAAADPESFPLPPRLAPEAVQRLLARAIAEMPDDVRAALEEVHISVLPRPDPRVHAAPDVDPLVLGLYRGRGLGERSVMDVTVDLDRIEVFQRNIERLAGDPETLEEELHVTLLHEIGHHLGWDEEDVEERGLA